MTPFLLLTAGPVLRLLSAGSLSQPAVEQVVPPLTIEAPRIDHSPVLQTNADVACLWSPAPPAEAEISHPGATDPRFLERLTALRPRIESLIRRRWYDDFDTYELDNLVQAGLIRLWKAYTRDPERLNAAGDPYWYVIAKTGARHELSREYRQRFRRQRTGDGTQCRFVEMVLNTDDLLAAKATAEHVTEWDETSLSHDTVYARETDDIQTADRRIDIPRLERLIFSGTNPVDHPLIRTILGFMREGMTKQEMAVHAGVNVATIRCAIRRMQQACGAAPEVHQNQKRPGASLDGKIRSLRERGLGGPAIARLIGMDWTFVYRRLRLMKLM
jgi:DNA-directed RNA polymerase specialized sigma24 family protein